MRQFGWKFRLCKGGKRPLLPSLFPLPVNPHFSFHFYHWSRNTDRKNSILSTNKDILSFVWTNSAEYCYLLFVCSARGFSMWLSRLSLSLSIYLCQLLQLQQKSLHSSNLSGRDWRRSIKPPYNLTPFGSWSSNNWRFFASLRRI